LTDFVTVLEAEPGKILAKRYTDPTAKPAAFDDPFLYRNTRAAVDSLDELAEVLALLASDPTACIIRGARIPNADGVLDEYVPRRCNEAKFGSDGVTYESAAHHWICIDFDATTGLLDPKDVRGSIEAWRRTLPAPLNACGMVFQLSASAHLYPYIRGHAWVWSAAPVEDGPLRRWLSAIDSDPALAQSIQLHYTADPIFPDGIADPLAGSRLHLFDGPNAVIDFEVAPAKADPVRALVQLNAESVSSGQSDLLDAIGPAVDHEGRRWHLCGALGGVWRRQLRSAAWAEAQIRAWLAPVPGCDVDAGVARCLGAWRIPFDRGTGAGELALHLGGDTAWAERIAKASARRSSSAAIEQERERDPFAPVENEPLLRYYPTKGNAAPVALHTVDNAVSVLSDHGEWSGRLSFDLFSERVLVLETPWGFSGEWADNQTTELACWLGRYVGLDVGFDIVDRAVNAVARANAVNVLATWLDGLVWDGEERLAAVLPVLFGAPDTAYVRAVSKAFLVMLVARAFEPGCQADYMLVLEGPQGARKSSALRALIGPDWFSDTTIAIGSKDALLAIRGKWVHEIAELASFNRVAAEEKKAFLTNRVDRYREPFGRRESDHPRTCVFVGTTNDDLYLKDATGGRRFWPVPVGTIDLSGIAEHREQIFAEAVAAYRAGALAYLTPDEEALARVEQAGRDESAEDAWDNAIDAFLKAWEACAVATEAVKSSGTPITGSADSVARAAYLRSPAGFKISDTLLAVGLQPSDQDRRSMVRAKALLSRRGYLRGSAAPHLYRKQAPWQQSPIRRVRPDVR